MTDGLADRLWALNLFAALALFLVTSLLVTGEPDRLQHSHKLHQGEMIELGALIYSENCQSCHGIRGEGMGQLGPALNAEPFFTTRLSEVGWLENLESYIYGITEHGRMMGTREFYAGNGSTWVMPPWHERYGGVLRSDQLKAVTAFVLNWQATATEEVVLEKINYVPPKLSSSLDQAAGKQPYKQHCAVCHVSKDFPHAQIKGPDLSEITVDGGRRVKGLKAEEYIRESVLIPSKYLVEGYEELSREHSCGAVLSQSELDNVVDYLM